MRRLLFVIILALAATPALAQDKDSNKQGELPPGVVGSGAITLQQLTEDLQFLITEKYGIVVAFVLPRGWELVEQGIDPKTGKLREDLNVYSVISRAPVAKKGDPTDLIFELHIFKRGLLEDLPKNTKPEDKTEAVQFRNFLDEQLGINLKAGLKCLTKAADINAKPYGPPTRPKTYFVPIFYEVPPPPDSGGKGSMLYTFTSVAGNKIWMLKFLVSKDQVDNYGALIAFVLDNALAMTKQQYEEQLKNMPKDKQPASPGKEGAKP
jgi:hypothetical protein